MTKTVVTLFAGGGVGTLGAVAAGYTPVGAVEYAPEIAEYYALNVSPLVTVANVEDVDPRPYAGIDLLMASPVCTRMSVANANRGETDVDRIAAEGVCRWLRDARPKRFVMENVTQYRVSDSCKSILKTLDELGYFWAADNCNSANYAVPQTRRRLIVRAALDMLPALPAPTPWVGWYAAVANILGTLPESRFADWQLKRLPENFRADAGDSALLLEGDAAGDRPPTCRTSAQPCFTIKTSSGGRVHRAWLTPCGTSAEPFLCGVQGEGGQINRSAGTPAPTVTTAHDAGKYRALLEQGHVVAMTPRALARFMSLPDSYNLPDSRTLASKIIGNGFPTLMAQRIIEGLTN